MNSRIPNCRRRRLSRAWRTGLLGLVAALFAADSIAQSDLLSTAMLDGVRRYEYQSMRRDVCKDRIERINERLAFLYNKPEQNAALIEDLEAELRRARRCVRRRSDMIASIDESLLQMQIDYVLATGTEESAVADQMQSLHANQAVRVATIAQIGRTRRQLETLGADPDADPKLLEEKQALLDELRATLKVARNALEDVQQQMQNLEMETIELQGGGGSAQLSWSVPTTRENGEVLSTGELAGYEIYMLTESTGEQRVIEIDDPLATSYKVTGLSSDTYHFSISAVDTGGQHSQLSQVVSKDVQ